MCDRAPALAMIPICGIDEMRESGRAWKLREKKMHTR